MRAIIAAAFILASTAAQAELVADTTMVNDKHTAVLIQLSDKPMSAKTCGHTGLRAVLFQLVDRSLTATPVAQGCWMATKDNHVLVYGETFDGERSFSKKIPTSEFGKGPGFTKWSDFWLKPTDHPVTQ